MRTYTIRDVRGSGEQTTFVVDMVLHLEGDLVGPGSTWASQAAPGDRIVVLGAASRLPLRRDRVRPGAGRGPAAGRATRRPCRRSARCSSSCPRTPAARSFLEVPVAADVQDVRRPAGVDVVWLAREGDELGVGLHDAVVAHLGHPQLAAAVEVAPDEVDPDLWETPSYSSSGEEVAGDVSGVGRHVRLDRGGVEGGHRPAPAPGQRARLRPPPGGLHGLLAPRRGDEVLTGNGSTPGRDRPGVEPVVVEGQRRLGARGE